MHMDKIASLAAQLAANAKNGTLLVAGVKYRLKFDVMRWLYLVYGPDGNEVTNFNCKSLKTARQWLREYLAN